MISRMLVTTTQTITWDKVRICHQGSSSPQMVARQQVITRCMMKRRPMTQETKVSFTKIESGWLSIWKILWWIHSRRTMWGLKWHTWVRMPYGEVRDRSTMRLPRCLNQSIREETPHLLRLSQVLEKFKSIIIVSHIFLKWFILITKCVSILLMKHKELELWPHLNSKMHNNENLRLLITLNRRKTLRLYCLRHRSITYHLMTSHHLSWTRLRPPPNSQSVVWTLLVWIRLRVRVSM